MTVALALGGRVTPARTSTSTSSLRGARARRACHSVPGRQPAFPLRRRFLVSPGPFSGERLEMVCVNPPLNATQHCPPPPPSPPTLFQGLLLRAVPPEASLRSPFSTQGPQGTEWSRSPPTMTSFIPCVVVPVPDDVCEPCHDRGRQ